MSNINFTKHYNILAFMELNFVSMNSKYVWDYVGNNMFENNPGYSATNM